MKITRLAALAKEHKSIVLINTEQDGQIIRQHVMVGMAVYPMDGFAQMDGDELLAVLDVPLEKRKEYSVFVKPMGIGLSLLTADNGQTDAGASETEVELRLPWVKILSVYTQSGLLFINADYKRVIEKEKDVTWWSRTLPSGAVVLVAKKGYQAIASIMPETNWMTEGLCDDLWHIAQAARNAFERQKGGTVQHEQQTMWRNEEDPKVLPDVRKLQATVLPGDA